jgi:hypothetical protein
MKRHSPLTPQTAAGLSAVLISGARLFACQAPAAGSAQPHTRLKIELGEKVTVKEKRFVVESVEGGTTPLFTIPAI